MAVRTFLHYTGDRDAGRLRPERLGRDAVLLYGGPRKRLHHLCYGAPGEDFARVRESLRRAGVAEYYYDLDYIPEGCAWDARDFPPAESLYVWGPPCPADFGENKEAWT